MIPLRDNLRTSRPSVVNWSIIGACVAVYVWQLTQPDRGLQYAFVPHHVLAPGHPLGAGVLSVIGSAFLSMFMHANLLHLGGNMLFLWIFGNSLEDRLGRPKYALFYFTCGLLATTGHTLLSGFSPVPIIGASGAIAGVLGGYWVLLRGATIRAIVPILFIWTLLDVPAWIFIGLWFGYQLLLAAFGGGAIAFWAHITGFVAGVLLVKRFLPPPPRYRGTRVIRVKFD